MQRYIPVKGPPGYVLRAENNQKFAEILAYIGINAIFPKKA